MIRTLLAAALLAGTAGAMSASAAMLPKADTSAATSNPVQTQYRDRDHDRGRWVPGRRYNAPPPNWRRYGARPGDWRRRGCVTVGPVWFCP